MAFQYFSVLLNAFQEFSCYFHPFHHFPCGVQLRQIAWGQTGWTVVQSYWVSNIVLLLFENMSQTSVNDTFSISFWEARKASWRYTNLSSAFVKCFNEVRHGEKKWSQFTSGMWFRIFRTDWHTKKNQVSGERLNRFRRLFAFDAFAKWPTSFFLQPQIFQRPYRQSIPPTAAQPLPFWTYSCDRNLNLSCRDVENDSISMGWSPLSQEGLDLPGRLKSLRSFFFLSKAWGFSGHLLGISWAMSGFS